MWLEAVSVQDSTGGQARGDAGVQLERNCKMALYPLISISLFQVHSLPVWVAALESAKNQWASLTIEQGNPF